ncbi:MAG: histidine phosphatase family protein [Hyphomicrobiaceae bacterium]|nr:histidine phosphatase family protein [Hyphomicrobiaceae bacterium]
MSRLSALAAACALFLAGVPGPASAADEAALWDAVRRGDAFVTMRHALAPGTGDPPGYRIGNCASQRNLSEAGRAQARRIGERFRSAGIASARVMTSQWCRCKETAELLGLGPPSELPALNSFFDDRRLGPAQTAQVQQWLAARSGPPEPIVLVTHQVNITSLTGEVPRSGGMVIARRNGDGRIVTLGEIDVP